METEFDNIITEIISCNLPKREVEMKISGFITCIILCAALLSTAGPQTALAAVPITDCQQLQDMRNNLSGSYYLANDIDCTATLSWNAGAGFEPIGTLDNPFTGSLDGKDHKIHGLYINRPA